MRSAASPKIAGQKGLELSRDKTHLRWEMHSLFADVLEVRRQLLVKKYYSLAIHHAVLGATKRKYVDPGIFRNLLKTRIQTNCGICDAGPIHVQYHIVLMRKAGKFLHFSLGVDSSHLGGLGD